MNGPEKKVRITINLERFRKLKIILTKKNPVVIVLAVSEDAEKNNARNNVKAGSDS